MKLAVRVRPGARTSAVGGRWDGPRGSSLLVSVRARAVDGAANAAVLDALADAFGVRRSAVALISGMRGRDKTVEITGDGSVLRIRLAELTGDQ